MALSRTKSVAVFAPRVVAAVGLKFTVTEQLVPPARTMPLVQPPVPPVVSTNWFAFTPPSVKPFRVLNVMFALPVFDTVMVCGVPSWPRVMLPNEARLGVTDAIAPTPVPVSATVCGLVGSASVTVIAALSAPVRDGLNLTLILQLRPAARFPPIGQVVLASTKSAAFVPVIAMPVIASGTLPVLTSVAVRLALAVPMVWLPYGITAGDRSTAVPVPVSETVSGGVTTGSEPLMVSVASRVPATVGVNVMLIVQFAPAARPVPPIGQAFAEIAKSPAESPMGVMISGASPVFMSVTDCGALVVGITWIP